MNATLAKEITHKAINDKYPGIFEGCIEKIKIAAEGGAYSTYFGSEKQASHYALSDALKGLGYEVQPIYAMGSDLVIKLRISWS